MVFAPILCAPMTNIVFILTLQTRHSNMQSWPNKTFEHVLNARPAKITDALGTKSSFTNYPLSCNSA